MSTKPAVVHSDPEILGGTAVFVGTRVPVENLYDYFELNAKGECAGGVAMYESTCAVCTEHGAQTAKSAALYEGQPTD